MLLHGSDLPFDCLLCLERMTSIDVLERHVIMHMVKQSRYLDDGEEKIVQNKEVNIKIEFEDSDEGNTNVMCNKPMKQKWEQKEK